MAFISAPDKYGVAFKLKIANEFNFPLHISLLCSCQLTRGPEFPQHTDTLELGPTDQIRG
uniref:Uncharacterized protein n=1 Tax=Anguilla anguilla TaxID=7936 RepID=A0A0E9VA22_ANGAN